MLTRTHTPMHAHRIAVLWYERTSASVDSHAYMCTGERTRMYAYAHAHAHAQAHTSVHARIHTHTTRPLHDTPARTHVHTRTREHCTHARAYVPMRDTTIPVINSAIDVHSLPSSPPTSPPVALPPGAGPNRVAFPPHTTGSPPPTAVGTVGAKGLPGAKIDPTQSSKQPMSTANAMRPVRRRPTLARNRGKTSVPTMPKTAPPARINPIAASFKPSDFAKPGAEWL